MALFCYDVIDHGEIIHSVTLEEEGVPQALQSAGLALIIFRHRHNKPVQDIAIQVRAMNGEILGRISVPEAQPERPRRQARPRLSKPGSAGHHSA
jgi:hypothetical protein